MSRGVARRYTDADLIVLSQVRSYLVRSFTFAEVQTFLAQKTSAAIITPAPDQVLAATPVILAASLSMPSDPIQHATDFAQVRKGKDP